MISPRGRYLVLAAGLANWDFISTRKKNIDRMDRTQRPSSLTRSRERPVSSPDATMTTAGATESVGGGEAVGVPSLRQAASGLAAALGQGAAVAREVTRLGP